MTEARAPRSNRVLIDVTTLIGAEEYIRSCNEFRRPYDPFAKTCYAELTQTLLLVDRVYVAHPVLASPRPNDFGDRPRILRRLVDDNGLSIVRMDIEQWNQAGRLDADVISQLQESGGRTVLHFIDQVRAGDSRGSKIQLGPRIREWSQFQENFVRVQGSHSERILTPDGIEDDEFGHWVRACADIFRGELRPLADSDAARTHLLATLGRGLRYAVRGQSLSLPYQSHPIRRDFSLSFQLGSGGISSSIVDDVIESIRGIQASIGQALGESGAGRMKVLEMELPLLGGRVWSDEDVRRWSGNDWLDFVVEKIMILRDRAAPLREAISECVTEEDSVRLVAKVEQSGRQLMEHLGLRKVEMSSVERDLYDGVGSMTTLVPGVPRMTGVLLGARGLARQRADGRHSLPFQRFLYKEFAQAYRASA